MIRDDIQALRALAVSAVVLYHLWPRALPGGYVGVDVFFVISGFLITRHLLRELERTGSISVVSFWGRRIRRLLPAAVVVLVASTVMLRTFMSEATWRTNLAEIGASSVYVLNWLLASMSVDYLASDDPPSLVQHYWSLGVEEQFYLVWPLVLGVTWIAAAKVSTRPHRSLTVMVALVGALSLAFSVSYTAANPEMAFFVTPTRVWEFALGGLVALGVLSGTVLRGPRIAFLGFGLIIGSVAFLSESVAFPGWIALIPTVGAALVIIAGSEPAPPSRDRILSARWIQWLGDNSYSLYLWHWPLIVVAPWVLHRPTTTSDNIIVLALALALAGLTKRYVEDPLRAEGRFKLGTKPAYAFAGISAALMVAVSATSYADLSSRNSDISQELSAQVGEACFGAAAVLNDCPDPFTRPPDRLIGFAAADIPDQQAAGCQISAAAPVTPKVCTAGETQHPHSTIAIVGNSYAIQFMPLLHTWGQENSVQVLLMARTDCLGLSQSPVPGQLPTDRCLGWSRAVEKLLTQQPDLTGIIFTSHEGSDEYLTGQVAPSARALAQAEANVRATLTRWKERGIATAVVKHPPGTRPDPAPECVALRFGAGDTCERQRALVTEVDFLAAIAGEHPELSPLIVLDDIFCDELLCHAAVGGVVAYYDDHHISATFAQTLRPFFDEHLDRLSLFP